MTRYARASLFNAILFSSSKHSRFSCERLFLSNFEMEMLFCDENGNFNEDSVWTIHICFCTFFYFLTSLNEYRSMYTPGRLYFYSIFKWISHANFTFNEFIALLFISFICSNKCHSFYYSKIVHSKFAFQAVCLWVIMWMNWKIKIHCQDTLWCAWCISMCICIEKNGIQIFIQSHKNDTFDLLSGAIIHSAIKCSKHSQILFKLFINLFIA